VFRKVSTAWKSAQVQIRDWWGSSKVVAIWGWYWSGCDDCVVKGNTPTESLEIKVGVYIVDF
jgi:hypothetical protein